VRVSDRAPTETLIGLSCRADDESARARIVAMKGIEAPRGFIVLVDDFAVLALIAPSCDRRTELLRGVWRHRCRRSPLAASVPWASNATASARSRFAFR
jgi:hypothetical protein